MVLWNTECDEPKQRPLQSLAGYEWSLGALQLMISIAVAKNSR